MTFPIKIADGAPPVPTYGMAIARPANADVDAERNVVDNVARPGGVIALPPIAPARQAAGEGPDVVALPTTSLLSVEPSMSDYRILNHGTATAENIRFIVVTPLYVNTSTAGSLPEGCAMVLTDPDPAVPEIVECAIGTLEPGQAKEIQIPVKAVPNGPKGELYGATVVTTAQPGSGRAGTQNKIGQSSMFYC